MPRRPLSLPFFAHRPGMQGFACITLAAFGIAIAAAQDDLEPLEPPAEPAFPREFQPDVAEPSPPDIDPIVRDDTDEDGAPAESVDEEGTSPESEADETAAAAPAESEEGIAEAFSVPEEMKVFAGHVGYWRGLSKSVVDEEGEKTSSTARSEWRGGYLMGGHLFELRGYEYGDLGRTQYQWQYGYDRLKERYLAVYRDSHGRTFFFEGITNEEGSKILWRLVIPPGDMKWETETDLVAEDGIETKGTISSEEYGYNRAYTAIFKRK